MDRSRRGVKDRASCGRRVAVRASLLAPTLAFAAAAAACAAAAGPDEDVGVTEERRPALVTVDDFGSNPGGLRMLVHAPRGLGGRPGLVVALHGCGQTARSYAAVSGWLELADRRGFVLVFPESAPVAGACFGWFDAAQVGRGRGQALSIAQMVARAMRDHDVDAGRVFVTGFSAGGFMATALLAAYPDVFAAGAVIAGGPAGCDVTCMTQPARDPARWAEAYRAFHPSYRGPLPRLLAFQGEYDPIVAPEDEGALVDQWTAIHGVDEVPEVDEEVAGHRHRVYEGGVAETYLLSAYGHTIPVDPGSGEGQGGTVGPYAWDADLWSAYVAAGFFGI